jgi:hypothetical protein
MRWMLFLTLAACGTKDATDSGAATGGAEPVDCTERSYDLPSTRGEVNGVWDAARGRMVLFGGDEGMPNSCIPQPEFLDETWAFHPDCDNFEQIAIEGARPPARTRHASALDAERGRMLMFGGRWREGASGNYTVLTDMWSFDLETNSWTELPSEDGPRPRVTHSMVISGDQMLVYGGNSTPAATSYFPMADLWSYDLVDHTWTRLEEETPAGKRHFHASAISDDGGKMYVYGGGDENAYLGPFFGDLWAYRVETGTWSMLHDGDGEAPFGRIMPNMIFDGAENRLLLWSGHDDGNLGNSNQVWAFDLNSNTWSPLTDGDAYANPAYGFCDFPPDFVEVDVNAPERRYFGAAVLADSELLIFGGKTDCGQINDAWSWDLETQEWTERSAATFGEVCLRSSAGDCESLCF